MENNIHSIFFKFLSIGLSILVLYYIYKTHEYLVSLDSCDCAPKLYSDRLKNIELFYLFLSLGGIVMNLFSMFFKHTETIYKNYIKVLLSWIVIVYIVHSIFVYNTYMFYSNVKSDCACSNSWEKEFIYIQAIIYGLPIFMVIFVLILSLFVSLLRTLTVTSSITQSYKPKGKSSGKK